MPHHPINLPTPHPLPHHNQRPAGVAIDTIVIHSMFAEGSAEPTSIPACIALLNFHEVSAHYAIGREGDIWALVPEELRAWHARSRTAPRDRMPFADDSREQVNDFSIGIEVVTSGHEGDFTEPQYDAVIELIGGIRSRHPITAIVGHEHIAPGRKTDPGPQFDWRRIVCSAAGEPTESGAMVRFPEVVERLRG